MHPAVVSHYRLLNHLGEGGMGIVYRAEDLRLGREVAVKLLRAEAIGSAEWLARFEREARLASSMQHPHICTIHELGEHEGQPFIAMELLEGRTIRQLIEPGPLTPERVVAFAMQIAEALDAAHRRGIVHRDLKPANLFVTEGDRLKILDFGLAKLTAGVLPIATADAPTASMAVPVQTDGDRMSPDLTRTGSTVGTACYMSPEQATGSPVDARTDLFSLGSVLYEMATGRRAFGGDDIPLITMKIINGILVSPRMINDAVPEALERVILRLMAVDPAARYQTAADLLVDLRGLTRQLGTPAAAGRRGFLRTAAARLPRRPAQTALAAVAIILIAGLVGLVWQLRRSPALTDSDRILIGAFENTTGDPVFDETLETALKGHLDQSPFLDLVEDARIRETLESMNRAPGERLTHEVGREVCQRLGVKAMLEGSIAPLGRHFVIRLAATDCATGETLARRQAEATDRERVLAELGAISSSMRTALGESLPSLQKFDVPIEQATTPSLAALKAYALGVEERRRGRELESIAFFNQAIEHDREFASAYTTLSTIYGSLGEWRRSEEYARRANAVQRRVSERERLFITYQFHDRVTGDQARAAQTLEIWKAAYPRDSRPVNALALISNRLGRYDRAVAEARQALERSPGHPFPLSNLAFAYRALGRYADARRTAEQAVALGVATSPTRRLLYQLGFLSGDGSAEQHLAWARERPREFDLVSAQAQAAAYEGRVREAARLYQQAADIALARGLRGTASGFMAHLAWTESLYELPPSPRGGVAAIVAGQDDDSQTPAPIARFRAAAALALAGHVAEASRMATRARDRYPQSTFVASVLGPTTRAAIALRQSNPEAALAALEEAVPTELGTVAGLVPLQLRAEAHLQKRAFREAAAEYERLLQHRGVDPLTPAVPLAHLGIARAKAQLGDADGSRRSYEALFQIWTDADEGLPPLVAARAEYQRLTGVPVPIRTSRGPAAGAAAVPSAPRP